MKERPILFSGEMARALLEDRKGQTRREVKASIAEAIEFAGGGPNGERATTESFGLAYAQHIDDRGRTLPAEWLISSAEYPEDGVIPVGQGYGAVGDRLWVKETYAVCADNHIEYRATAPEGFTPDFGWKPSIFMPRWASRITLELVEVRIERLQSITPEDAIAEGVTCVLGPAGAPSHFRELWKRINGTESWAADPWVWAITFRRVQ